MVLHPALFKDPSGAQHVQIDFFLILHKALGVSSYQYAFKDGKKITKINILNLLLI